MSDGNCYQGTVHLWHLVPGPTIHFPSARLRRSATYLLEEERDAGALALVPEIARPIEIHRTIARPALAANYHPVQPLEQ